MKQVVFFLFFSIPIFGQQIDVFFDFSQDKPNESSLKQLQKWINENGTVEIIKLSGYCDSVDDSTFNKELASRRIASVLKFLRQKEVMISSKIILDNNGKDFKQSKIQAENRKVIVYYTINQFSESLLKKEIEEAPRGTIIKLNNIYFYNNSSFTSIK
jgi:hypothetical protein